MGEIKMKDPCDSCIVKVTCWQECDDKRNYGTLISNALKQYNNPYAMVRYNNLYRKYLNLSQEHIVSR